MKKKKNNTECSPMTEEEFLEKERERNYKNKLKNKPIIVTTYIMVAVMMSLFLYIIYFMQFKAETTIANSHNNRQDNFAQFVERGDIITSDGVVIASSETVDGVTIRSYPYGEEFAHLVGYEKYGKAGLELQGNFYMLRSHVNIFERIYKEMNDEKNRGDNVITTVDYSLQNAAYNAMGSCNGAVIAIEPSTGKIRIMLSKPSYDPNDIDNLWEYLQTEEGSKSTVLLNRATQGLYAPGSTFKIVSVLEYIRENKSTYESYEYNCNGSDIYNGVDIHCANSNVHGTESLKDSFANSCNTSFANMGLSFNYANYRKTAEDLLFNKDLPFQGEYNSSYFDITAESSVDELPQTVIGQGNTRVTPLHIALIASAIANDGKLMKPYLIQSVKNDDGANVKRFSGSNYGRLMSEEEAEILTEYMKAVCDYGTAANYFSGLEYDVAGKTGTAEYDNEGGCNSWFVGFSNPDDPDLVVCVIVEDYNIYGISATSVAKAVFDEYYSK